MKNEKLKFRPIRAYLASITAMSLFFDILMTAHVWISGSFRYGPTMTLGYKFVHSLLAFLVAFAIVWVLAFFSALIPFSIACIFIYKFNIKNIFFFALGASATAVLVAPYFSLEMHDEGDWYWQHVLHQTGPYIPISGLLAGIVCWSIIRPVDTYREKDIKTHV